MLSYSQRCCHVILITAQWARERATRSYNCRWQRHLSGLWQFLNIHWFGHNQPKPIGTGQSGVADGTVAVHSSAGPTPEICEAVLNNIRRAANLYTRSSIANSRRRELIYSHAAHRTRTAKRLIMKQLYRSVRSARYVSGQALPCNDEKHWQKKNR